MPSVSRGHFSKESNMNYRRITAGALALSLAAVLISCGGGKGSESDTPPSPTTSAAETTEPTTEEELIPPEPVEADDPNAITFDDGDVSFAKAITDDKDSASGTIEIGEFNGNKMLRFTDSGNAAAEKLVQKVSIDAAKLLTPEDLAKVRRIEFDLYADATASDLVTNDAVGVKAPGWIGGGGGANVSGDKWYDFAEFAGGEYNFEMSGATHVVFKFLLAGGGMCWDSEMEEAIFLIMRWGVANEGNMYIDNIVFYDEEGKSLPITKRAAEEPSEAADSAAAVEDGGFADDTAEIDMAKNVADGIESKYESIAEEFPED